MITRIWHGRTSPENAATYLHFLLTEGTREYRETAGNRSVKVWQKETTDSCHFFTVTEWNDLASVKQFAGDDYDKAKYYPEDEGILLEFEANVEHYASHDVSAGRVREYCRQLEQAYRGGSWQGESFLEKLKPVDEHTAFRQPYAGVHSIAEIVWHVIYWRTVLIKRLEGNAAFREQTLEQLNFLPLEQLQAKGWEALKHEFHQTQAALLGHLQQRDDAFLQTEYEPGHTYDHLLEGIVQHDVYHLGQIGLVARMVGVKKE